MCLYVFQGKTHSSHPVILQSYYCSAGEHTRVNPYILVITKSWWNSFAENNSLIRTMSKLITHPYNFMSEITMIYFTEVYGVFPTIWNTNFHTNKVCLRKGLWENLYYEMLLLQLKYYLCILQRELKATKKY